MKINIRSITNIGAVLILSATGACGADWVNRLYLSGDAGAAFTQSVYDKSDATTLTFNPGYRADLALGYNINDSWAVELESGVIGNSVDEFRGGPLSRFHQSVDLYQVPLLAKVIYNINTKSAFVPYLGAGAGGVASIFDFNDVGVKKSDTDFTFAYQAEAGLKYLLSKNISIGIGYKFIAAGESGRAEEAL